MKKFTLYVGLNDQVTKQQEIGTVDAYKIATNVFCEYTGGATIYESRGVYTHNNGDIVVENTLVCIVFSDDQEAIKKAASALKVAFNQETIAIESTETNSIFF